MCGSNKKNPELLSQYKTMFKTSAAFAGARACTGLLDQPLDVIETTQQAVPGKGLFATIRNIYKTHGIKRFYTGYLPNLVNSSVTACYRGPIICFFPKMLNRHIPEGSQAKYPWLSTVFTIPILVGLDTTVSTPLERIKNLQITGSTYRSMFHTVKSTPGTELFQGLQVIFVQKAVSWSSFLLLDDLGKSAIRRLSQSGEVTALPLLGSSFCVGTMMAVINTPFSFAVVQAQKESPVTEKNALRIINGFIKKNGLASIFSGWRGRVLQSILNVYVVSALREWVTEYIEPTNISKQEAGFRSTRPFSPR
jgi:hypothetical protein